VWGKRVDERTIGKVELRGKKTLTGAGHAQAKAMTRFVNTLTTGTIRNPALNSGVAYRRADSCGVPQRRLLDTNTFSNSSMLRQRPWHNGTDGIQRRHRRSAKVMPHRRRREGHRSVDRYTSWLIAQAQTLGTAKIITPAGPDAIGISPTRARRFPGHDSGQGNDLVLDRSRFDRPSQPGSYRSCWRRMNRVLQVP